MCRVAVAQDTGFAAAEDAGWAGLEGNAGAVWSDILVLVFRDLRGKGAFCMVYLAKYT